MNLKLLKICAFAALLAGLSYGVYTWHTGAIKEAVSVSESKMKETHRKAQETALKASNRAAEALRANADKERQKKDEKIADINARLDDALVRLRNRPSRTSPLPQDTSTSQACTATALFREDAEFLTREAARADSILVERDYYYEQYEAVRKQLNGTTKQEQDAGFDGKANHSEPLP